MADILSRIKLRNDTAAAWASANPVLQAGEPGFERDTKRLRIGDGVTAFSALPYFYLSSEFNSAAYVGADVAAYNAALNALTGKKFVQVGGSATNGWTGMAAGDVVFHWDIDGTNAVQFGIEKDSTYLGLWHRAKVSGTWGTWRRPVDNGSDETVAGNKTFSGNTILNGSTTILSLLSTVLAGGYTTASANDGTPAAASTYRPDPLAATPGNMRHITNNAAFTLAAPNRAGDYTMSIHVTNGATPGVITLSGFNTVYGDAFTTTTAHAFIVHITKHNGSVSAVVQRVA